MMTLSSPQEERFFFVNYSRRDAANAEKNQKPLI
jgi:hypothetical protein